MMRQLLDKTKWKEAIGASKEPKRQNLKLTADGVFVCPVIHCESESFRSQRGCRKHVFKKHGWYFYFDEKPNMHQAFPDYHTKNKL